jgi:nitrite reductase/ring-hydroxylating ferredoxin subunit
MFAFAPVTEDTQYVCTECGCEYLRMPYGGYCDESIECAGAESIYSVESGEVLTW